MKKLRLEEFQDRINAVVKARKIFIPHITKNISIAFGLYQEILAEQKRDIFLNTISGGQRSKTFIDRYKRPKCPKCGKELGLRILDELTEKENPKGWRTCWVCPDSFIEDAECFYEEYSRKSVNDWMQELALKNTEKENCDGSL